MRAFLLCALRPDQAVLFFALLCGGLLNAAFAQTGTIRGTVYDKESGDRLVGATVRVDGTALGAYTDVEGQFTIANVPVGMRSLTITYVSYDALTITDIDVVAGEVTVQNAYMGGTQTLEAVEITAKAVQDNEFYIINLQARSTTIVDGISNVQFQRNADNDAATAMTRVVGVSVQDGKYVYVRGLADRYTKTLVNGAEIPGLDPNRNSTQLDIFPSNLLNNIIVYKTFQPDLPGNFTGGLVDVTTRDFSDKFKLSVSFGVGYNDQATFNDDFLTYEGSGTDWLGFDNGFRDIPDRALGSQGEILLPDTRFGFGNTPAGIDRLNSLTREFNSQMTPQAEAAPMDHNFGFTATNQTTLFGKPFGYVLSMVYRRSFQHFEGEFNRWDLNSPGQSELTPFLAFDQDTRSTDDVLWGGLAGFSLNLNENNRIGLLYFHNQAGTSEARYQRGVLPDDGPNRGYESRVLYYNQRFVDALQLQGTHKFPPTTEGPVPTIDWTLSLIATGQDEPDFRISANDFTFDPATGVVSAYSITPSLYNPDNLRIYRDLRETDFDAKVHFTLPITPSGRQGEIKAGGFFVNKNRYRFRERRLLYDANSTSNNYGAFNGDHAAYYSDANTGWGANLGNDADFGLVLLDGTDPVNRYAGLQQVYGGYAMVEYPITDKLRFIGGARLEITDVTVNPSSEAIDNGNASTALLNTEDILPSANFIYALTDKMNLRLNYGRTLARPIFREFADYTSFSFIGDNQVAGNPNLTRTLIDNFDLRWELFPNPGEVVTVSAFYKSMQNPIERTVNIEATNGEFTWRNVSDATIYGFELEVKKNLGFISNALRFFQAGLNISVIESEVDISEEELVSILPINPEIGTTRPLYAQSPYMINASLGYVNNESRTYATLNFNVFGERLVSTGLQGVPDIYEQPQPRLDFSISQRFGQHLGIRASARNLLNPDVQLIQSYRGNEFIFSSYSQGRRFSLTLSYNID